MANPTNAKDKNNSQGYKTQPLLFLRWLQPGTVKSREFKPRKSRSKKQKEVEEKKNSDDNSSSSSEQSEEIVKSTRFDLIDLAGKDLNTLKWAFEYLHEFWYPKMLPLKYLHVKEYTHQVSPQTFQALSSTPYYIQDAMVCMAIFQQRAKYKEGDAQSKALLAKSLDARGRMLRSLSADLSDPEKRTGNMVIGGIFQLLYNDLARGISDGWRYHFAAAYKIMRLKGGLQALAEKPETHLLVRAFLHAGVVGDTTSPPTEQALAPQDTTHFETFIDIVEDIGYVLTTYPAFFFVQTMRINQLRAMTADRIQWGLSPDPNARTQAFSILNDIKSFSINETKGTPSPMTDSMLLGQSFKTALYIFCVLSLQSVSILPSSNDDSDPLAHIVSYEAETLAAIIENGLPNPKLKLLLLWHLTVLGVDAVNRGETRRDLVRRCAYDMYTYTGSYSVWHLKEVLETFWASGKTRWDDCWDKPYLFSPATNMDSSSLIPK
ncbi:hypothetical protein N7478_006486 [Penicillium angulare]|uniref:uncharacterized protein n=1 Tax=Penicillium angulare TaxID=116970 RepID=UPI00253FC979|nr:uncharacterized protein N7478_006486 [Penicillium angulare]KAJ5281114.1 hypothetical protein N7478_006486 [Penicillium angulare]